MSLSLKGIVRDIYEQLVRYPVYEDLGLIIDSSGIANNGVAESQIFANYEWVNNLIFKVQSDQSYDLYLYKINSYGISDWGNAIATGLSGTSTAFAGIAANVPIGCKFKIALINKSGGALATFKLYLEVKK